MGARCSALPNAAAYPRLVVGVAACYGCAGHDADVYADVRVRQHPGDVTINRYGGNTPLHDLALWHPSDDGSTDADRRRKNEICCTLVHAGASLLERNAAGQTAEEATYNSASYNLPCEKAAGGNRHLRATLKEMRMFRGLPHLGNEHFRHWTTVSHAWCPPSAKLTALTVLLVGCSFKRLAAERKLPRLPMDCWYRILNCIPRHELRQGGCEPAEEQAALAKYLAILQTAR